MASIDFQNSIAWRWNRFVENRAAQGQDRRTEDGHRVRLVLRFEKCSHFWGPGQNKTCGKIKLSVFIRLFCDSESDVWTLSGALG